MTLEQYKNQSKAIYEESENFKGTPEEAAKFFEGIAKKYPEVTAFNAKALECKDVTEFKKLADSVGMKFSNEESAEKFYSLLNGTCNLLGMPSDTYNSRVALSVEEMNAISGGGLRELWRTFKDKFIGHKSPEEIAAEEAYNKGKGRGGKVGFVLGGLTVGAVSAALGYFANAGIGFNGVTNIGQAIGKGIMETFK